MRAWGFYNLKGGVGKSSAAVNIAYLAAQAGEHVLLWDLDPQGASTWLMHNKKGLSVKPKKLLEGKAPIGRVIRTTGYDRLDMIPADFALRNIDLLLKKAGDENDILKRLIEPCGEQYSMVVLDCPPSLSKLSDNIFQLADLLAIPLIPSHLSLRAYDQIHERVKKANPRPKLCPFYSMIDGRRRLHREFLALPQSSIKGEIVGRIPYASAVEKMGDHRAPVETYEPNSDAAQAYRLLWKALRKADKKSQK